MRAKGGISGKALKYVYNKGRKSGLCLWFYVKTKFTSTYSVSPP